MRFETRDILAAGILAMSLLYTSPSKCQAATIHITTAPSSHLWLHGDSSLHTFASTATTLSGAGDWNVSAASATSAQVWPEILSGADHGSFTLNILVTGLKSGEKGLDKNMYHALKSDQDPQITFQLTSLKPTGSASAASASVLAGGTLEIAGVTKPIELQTVATTKGDALEIKGSTDLLMTDYGVKPPTLMMGAIKVRNKVTILFDMFLQLQTQP